MIQDIWPKQFENQFVNKAPKKDSTMMCFRGREIFLKEEGEIQYLTYEMVEKKCAECGVEVPKCVYLFSIDDMDYFLFELPEEITFEGFSYHVMFEVRMMKPMVQVLAASTAYHLFCWYDVNRICGRCGAPLIHSKTQRMLSCEHCNNMVFPKIAPAVIVGVTYQGKILLTRYRDREYTRHALIAGFVEIGESVEETVRREVMEEVGLKVNHIRYYKSQPWGFDSNVLVGYFCDLEENQEISLDQVELSAAKWYDAADVPGDTEGLSLTREMMDYFRNHKGQV